MNNGILNVKPSVATRTNFVQRSKDKKWRAHFQIEKLKKVFKFWKRKEKNQKSCNWILSEVLNP